MTPSALDLLRGRVPRGSCRAPAPRSRCCSETETLPLTSSPATILRPLSAARIRSRLTTSASLKSSEMSFRAPGSRRQAAEAASERESWSPGPHRRAGALERGARSPAEHLAGGVTGAGATTGAGGGVTVATAGMRTGAGGSAHGCRADRGRRRRGLVRGLHRGIMVGFGRPWPRRARGRLGSGLGHVRGGVGTGVGRDHALGGFAVVRRLAGGRLGRFDTPGELRRLELGSLRTAGSSSTARPAPRESRRCGSRHVAGQLHDHARHAAFHWLPRTSLTGSTPDVQRDLVAAYVAPSGR